MQRYLLICYVDTEAVSHDKEIVDNIISFINYSDIFMVDNTFLFNQFGDTESLIENFLDNSYSFLEDPVGLYPDFDIEESEDDDLDETERLIRSKEDGSEIDEIYVYDEDYVALFIHFVTSKELATEYFEKAKHEMNMDFNDTIIVVYEISCLDQMELMKKLQNPDDQGDNLQKTLMSTGERRRFFLEGLIEQQKN